MEHMEDIVQQGLWQDHGGTRRPEVKALFVLSCVLILVGDQDWAMGHPALAWRLTDVVNMEWHSARPRKTPSLCGKLQHNQPFVRVPPFLSYLSIRSPFPGNPRLNQPLANESCCSGVSGGGSFTEATMIRGLPQSPCDPQMLYLTHLFPRIPEISCQRTR